MSKKLVSKVNVKGFYLLGLFILFGFSLLAVQVSPTVTDDPDPVYQSGTSLAANISASVKEEFPEAKEVEEMRKEYSKTHLIETLPDGTKRYSLSSSTNPIHYKGANGIWQDLDTALLPSDGEWDYAMEKANYSFFVEKTLNSDKLVEFQKNGEYVRFALVSLDVKEGAEGFVSPSEVEGVVDGNEVNWKDAFGEGTKLSWTALPEKIAKILEIEKLSSLPSSGEGTALELTLKFEYSAGAEVVVDGEVWNGGTIETRNEIEFRGSKGETLWSFQEPLAWDSENKFSDENYFRVSNKNNKLYVTHVVPMDWIKTAEFPIYLDPELCVGGCTIPSGLDDVTINGVSGYENSGFFGLAGYLGSSYSAAQRFPGISGLGNAMIDTAHVSVFSAMVDDGPVGGINTVIRAEKTQAPTRITGHADFDSRNLTAAGTAWNNTGSGFIGREIAVVDVISEIAGLDPSVIQIFILDNGSATSESNYALYNSRDHPLGNAPVLNVVYSVAPLPDFRITQNEHGAFTAGKLIADNYPPKTIQGNRVIEHPAENVRLRGWVRNTAGPAGNVQLCFYSNRAPGDTPTGGDPCDAGQPLTVQVPSGGWNGEVTGGTPFGTACANVFGPDPGIVNVSDLIAIADKYGTGDPDYDLDDDGIVEPTDDYTNIAVPQVGITCQRVVDFATTGPGDFKIYGLVDPNNDIAESNEGNNLGNDSYTVVDDPMRSLDLNLQPSSKILEKDDEWNPGTQLTFSFSAEDEILGWSDDATLDLDILDYNESTLDIRFGLEGSQDTSISCEKATTCGSLSIPIYIKSTGTAVGIYPVTIRGVATQTLPPFTTGDVEIDLQITVLDKKPWFKTTSGDVAAKGRLSTSPPIVSITENIGAEYGQMKHNSICVYTAPPCVHNHLPPGFNSYVVNLGGQVGVLDNRPPGDASLVNFFRVYLTFDTSSVSGPVVEAEFEFMLGPFPSDNTTVGIYQSDSLSWTPAQLVDKAAAGALWHETNQVILEGGLSPLFTFNITTENVSGGKFTVPRNVASSINPGGLTQWVMMWTEELSWDGSCPVSTSCPDWYLRLSDPTLNVDSVLFQDVSTTYLGLSDGERNPFYSAKDWLIKNYASGDGGINEDFSAVNYIAYDPEEEEEGVDYSNNIYANLWKRFGEEKSEPHADSSTVPTATGVYKLDGDFDFQGYPANPGTEQNVVFFINGNLDIYGGGVVGTLPTNLRIIYIVNGDVTFNSLGGYQQTFDGMIITNGFFKSGNSDTDPNDSCLACALDIKGGVIAQQGFELGRDLGLSNDSAPAEQIAFDPSYLYYFARIEDPDVPGLDYSLLGEIGTVTREVPP